MSVIVNETAGTLIGEIIWYLWLAMTLNKNILVDYGNSLPENYLEIMSSYCPILYFIFFNV